MKNYGIHEILIATVLFLLVGLTSCDKDEDTIIPDPTPVLTEEEEHFLIYMREEEKLARDVYLYMYEKHDLNIFQNIASSEQVHTDLILELLIKYALEDPALPDTGKFSNNDLQGLYDSLIAQGDSTLLSALIVGATIEDVDILDLHHAIESTDKDDINDAYEKLMCGSRNHMRGFTNQLDDQDVTYSPQFITQAEYDDIINGEHEKCGK